MRRMVAKQRSIQAHCRTLSTNVRYRDPVGSIVGVEDDQFLIQRVRIFAALQLKRARDLGID